MVNPGTFDSVALFTDNLTFLWLFINSYISRVTIACLDKCPKDKNVKHQTSNEAPLKFGCVQLIFEIVKPTPSAVGLHS
jgi:hypothetical protein